MNKEDILKIVDDYAEDQISFEFAMKSLEKMYNESNDNNFKRHVIVAYRMLKDCE